MSPLPEADAPNRARENTVRQTTLFIGMLALSLLGHGQRSGVEAAPARVLYLTQSAAFPHPVLPHSEEVLTRLAAESDEFDVTVSHDASVLTANTLRQYDVVVFFTTGELPMNAGQRAALLSYVRAGGGFVGVHSATDTFYEWPGYRDLIGGYFDGHPWHQDVAVQVEDTHPSTQHLGESFRIHDEIYQHREWSRDTVDVLLSLDVSSVDMRARGINRDDADFALAWTRQEGAGRVFYTALGHRPEVWDDTRFQRHLLGGISWTMGTGHHSPTTPLRTSSPPKRRRPVGSCCSTASRWRRGEATTVKTALTAGVRSTGRWRAWPREATPSPSNSSTTSS